MNATSPTSREQFVRTVREALGPRAPLAAPPMPPAVDESLVRLAGPADDLVGMFVRNAEQVGMVVRRTTVAGLATQLLDVLRAADARSVTLAIDRLPMRDALREALTRSGIDLRAWEHDRAMASHYAVDAGVTDVHAALAETGTLICNSDAAHGRGGSLVPPVHIAIVQRGDILPDLLDYLRPIDGRGARPTDLPSAQALITGPSKTADIEGILITGVHGPGRVFVLVIEDA